MNMSIAAAAMVLDEADKEFELLWCQLAEEIIGLFLQQFPSLIAQVLHNDRLHARQLLCQKLQMSRQSGDLP